MAARDRDGALRDVPERAVQVLGRRLARRVGGNRRERLRRAVSPDERVMAWATARPEFKTALFRFVDVVPACHGDADVYRHLAEYLGNDAAPPLVAAAVTRAGRVPGGATVAARVARAGVVRMAHRFVGATDAPGAARRATQLWLAGQATTVDALGEKTVSLDDADAYAARLLDLFDALADASTGWPASTRLEADPWGALGRVHVSVKASALAPLLGPTTTAEGVAEATERLAPLLERAAHHGATVHLDAEHDELKDGTLALLRRIATDWGDRVQLGCVVQAYRRDAYDDLRSLCDLSAAHLARPLQIRLVKGAYWDTEVVRAAAHDWPAPVFTTKAETDASYERCTRLLVGRAGDVRPALASHNARSIAYAMVAVEHAGLPAGAAEYQLLHGMALPLHRALVELGLRTRVYVPVGPLVPGMAYLVRRLLENTANESFVRMGYGGDADLDALVAPPAVPPGAGDDDRDPDGDLDTDDHHDVWRSEPALEVRRPEERDRLERAVRGPVDVVDVPVLIGGRAQVARDDFVSYDPSDASTVVARAACAAPAHVDDAIASARDAQREWAAGEPSARAAVLRRAAAIMRRRRTELTALIVAEAGKPPVEADADVCEAIDFCEFYASEAERLADGVPIAQAPGERNEYGYEPLGVGAVIAPWNFPLAIPCGMTTAALVMGNAVVLKPAEETPAVALRLVEVLHEAGVPPGALALLPGYGDVGAALVAHPDTAFVAFTGSKAVGLEILATAARVAPGQRHVKRVIAEMGGKNAIVVDDDADLDEAVPAIVASAFGYAGQKCSAASRVITTPAVHDALVDRLAGATDIVPVGSAHEVRTVCGPLIGEEAWQRVGDHQTRAAREGTVVAVRDDMPTRGWFRPPMVVHVAPDAAVAREEVFGPLLALLAADDFDHAIALANDTEYALTAGCFSRSPSHLAHAGRVLRAGNVYLNRGITGALVGRQPFGGHGLSGVGTKAGGPDYLQQLATPRVVTENTLRSGFAADTVSAAQRAHP